MGILNDPGPSPLLAKVAHGIQIGATHSLEEYIKWHEGWTVLLSGYRKVNPFAPDGQRDRSYIAIPNYPDKYEEVIIQGPNTPELFKWYVIDNQYAKRVYFQRIYQDHSVLRQYTIYEISNEEYNEIISMLCRK